MEITFDGHCFGCGPLNEDGLRMSFAATEDGAVATFVVPERFQSWVGVVHGGMVALLLDEAVGWASWHKGMPGVTGRLEVRYRQPLRVGEEVRVRGRIDRVRKSLVYAASSIERVADGEAVADATATLMRATPVLSFPRG